MKWQFAVLAEFTGMTFDLVLGDAPIGLRLDLACPDDHGQEALLRLVIPSMDSTRSGPQVLTAPNFSPVRSSGKLARASRIAMNWLCCCALCPASWRGAFERQGVDHLGRVDHIGEADVGALMTCHSASSAGSGGRGQSSSLEGLQAGF